MLHVNRALQNAGRGRQAHKQAGSGKMFSGKPAGGWGGQQAATKPMVNINSVAQGQVSSGSQQSPPPTPHRPAPCRPDIQL
jgi:hypothetical protein